MMQSHVHVPCGLQGRMRGPSLQLVLARITPVTGFAGMSWCVCLALCQPWPESRAPGGPCGGGAGCWDRLCLSSGAEGAAEHPPPAGTLLTRKQGKKQQTLAQQRRYKARKSNHVSEHGGTGKTDCPPSGGSVAAEQTVVTLPVSTQAKRELAEGVAFNSVEGEVGS